MTSSPTLRSPASPLAARTAILACAVIPVCATLACCTSTRRGATSRGPSSEGATRPTRDGLWALVPADTDWMLLAMPGALPRELVGRFPSLAEAGPCRVGPPSAVLFLHGVRGADEAFTAEVRLFDQARAGCVPEAVGTHRQFPVISKRPEIGRASCRERV